MTAVEEPRLGSDTSPFGLPFWPLTAVNAAEALLGGAVVVCKAFAFAGVPLPPSALLSKIADLLPFKR